MKIFHAALAACATAGILAGTFAVDAHARSKSKRYQDRWVERECRPYNGRFGYYGNPFCDTGSYRLEDMEFRDRERAYQRHYKYRRD